MTSLLEQYREEDPRNLSESSIEFIAEQTQQSVEQVKALIKRMESSWVGLPTTEEDEFSEAGGGDAADSEDEPGAEAVGLAADGAYSIVHQLAHRIKHLEEAQELVDSLGLSLSFEDLNEQQRIKDILKTDPKLTREVAELVWEFNENRAVPPSGAKTILPYWKTRAKSKKVVELVEPAAVSAPVISETEQEIHDRTGGKWVEPGTSGRYNIDIHTIEELD